MQQDQGNPNGRGSARQSPAFAALGGALIGAAVGLVGSVLVFIQAERAQDATEHARQSDVRRNAYAEVGTSSQSFRTEIGSVVNFIGEATDEETQERHNTHYVPALTKLVQAEQTSRLVGTTETRKMLARTVPPRERLSEMVAFSMQGVEPLDVDKFDHWMKKYEKAFEAFLDRADDEVI
ncbi:hypothetical protein [Streptomyces spiramyceticus]|uniref:hypothetical protein n=1 Tax=Streptomyces spiramyceticus TaxID=299717 RepID=UPI00237C3111|nr:hypothetical protein [Streptomyces spiramyceticus]